MKRFMIGMLVVGLGLGWLSGNSWSQEKKGEMPLDPKALFNLLDRNQDGKVDREEYLKIWKDPAEGEKAFRQLDSNRDGFLTRQEFGLPGLTIMRW